MSLLTPVALINLLRGLRKELWTPIVTTRQEPM